MKEIDIHFWAGSFAENKDIAREIRLREVIPVLERKEEITVNFENVDSATQSFIHALISDPIRKFGVDVLDLISFKSCNKTIQEIITIVVEYMQEGTGEEVEEDLENDEEHYE